MKNFTLSLMAIATISTAVMAETYPTDGPKSYKALHDNDTGESVVDASFYLGLAYGLTNLSSDANINVSQVETINAKSDYDLNTIMLQAGYQFNEYIAIEGRYWRTFGNIDYTDTSPTHPSLNGSGSFDSDGEDAFGIYVKPIYPITEEFNVYALLGYASIDNIVADDDGFSWGSGVSYDFKYSNFSVFVDYVRLYDKSIQDDIYGYSADFDILLDSWNFGIAYRF